MCYNGMSVKTMMLTMASSVLKNKTHSMTLIELRLHDLY